MADGGRHDLDSDPTKLIDVVEIGKQLLITRGALTTFSVANDLAKYFAILPALFVALYPQLGALNVMQLATPKSAILSAVIFNALIIVALIPLALRGMRYRPITAARLLRRNLLVYGLGGVITPLIGISLVDLSVSGGSNKGGFSEDLLAAVLRRQTVIAQREGIPPAAVPPDAVTASASGLDPHISPVYAALQVPRVARLTGLSEAQVRHLVAEHTDGRFLGFLGEPGVNVPELNLAVRTASARVIAR